MNVLQGLPSRLALCVVTVLATGQQAVRADGGVIEGDVRVQRGADLYNYGATVGGNVVCNGCDRVELAGGLDFDGNRLPDLRFDTGRVDGEAIVGGDGKVPAISAASIIAKTTRDGIMAFLDRVHPEYEFGRHKGYGTRRHLECLRQHGPCAEHRNSFAPVRAAL